MRSTQIHNRRYLGNKHKLLPFITEVVRRECDEVDSIADLFCGTGAVASAFSGKELITNDLLYSNYIVNYAWFSPEPVNNQKIAATIEEFNRASLTECGGYMESNFADTYFSRANCRFIDHVRDSVEARFESGALTARERAVLITSLLYAMDRVAVTCGHYDAFRKGKAAESAPIELLLPEVYTDNNPANRCYNLDANKLASEIEADLVYLDPPYNSRQYCDAYHLLENVARWQKPEVHGVARKMDRKALKSDYCTASAAEAMDELVRNLNCRYILLSYNNMGNKGNSRSNAKISDGEIMDILSRRGEVTVFSVPHKAFGTGLSDIRGNEERLFLCRL